MEVEVVHEISGKLHEISMKVEGASFFLPSLSPLGNIWCLEGYVMFGVSVNTLWPCGCVQGAGESRAARAAWETEAIGNWGSLEWQL